MTGALVVTGVAVASLTLFVHVVINTNEGWNALHAVDAGAGKNIYLQRGYGNFVNYPPLSFYLIGGLGRAFGDLIFIGRVVSLGSMLVVALNVAFAARAAGASRDGAAFGGLMFLLFSLLNAPSYAAMNDPQWLAHAVQTTALVLLIRVPPERLIGRNLASSSAIMLVAGFIKHNLLGLPLAVTWFLLRYRRALVPLWIVAGAVGLLIALGACYGLFGPRFFEQLFGHRRVYSIDGLLVGLARLLPHIPFIVIAGFVARTHRNDPRIQILWAYVVASAIVGLVFFGGRGVAMNAYFDVSIGAMCLLGVAASRPGFLDFGRSAPIARKDGRFLGLGALTIALIVVFGWGGYVGRIASSQNGQRFGPAIAAIAAAPGPVACANLAFCYWAGRDSEIDFGNAWQSALLDPAFETEFATFLESRTLAMIQTGSSPGASYPGAVGVALTLAYRPVMTRPTTLLVPFN